MLIRRLIRAFVLNFAIICGLSVFADVEIVNGIPWTYSIHNGIAAVGGLTGLDECEWKWNLSQSGKPTCAAVPYDTSGKVIIPSTLGGCPVTFIGMGVFEGCEGITMVVIPSTVRVIGANAFEGMTNLRSVKIDEGLTHIHSWAFSECDKLDSINIPKSVSEIDEHAFSGCDSLGEGVVIVDDCVLGVNGKCPERVVLSNKIRLIVGEGILSYSAIKAIPKSVKRIGNINLDGAQDGLVIKDGCLLGVKGTCPEHVVVPDGVRIIARGAFVDCDLKSISIPASVTDIGQWAFFCCYNLSSISVSKDSQYFEVIDNVLYDKVKKALVVCVSDKDTIAIPDGIERICDAAFDTCTKVQTLTIPSSVVSIGEYALCAEKLSTITIPSSVIYLRDDVFGDFDEENRRSIYFKGEMPITSEFDGFMFGGGRMTFCDGTENEFDYEELTHTTVYVPSNKKSWVGVTRWFGASVVQVDAQKYHVQLNANGGQIVQELIEVEDGTAIMELPEPMREGYDFCGWYTLPNGGSRVSSGYVVNDDLTIYAHWCESSKSIFELFRTENVSFDASADNMYNGIIVDDKGKIYGRIDVRTAKVTERSRLSKISITIETANSTKKTSLRGSMEISPDEVEQETDIFGNLRYQVWTKPTFDDDGNFCLGCPIGINLTESEFDAMYGTSSDYQLSSIPGVKTKATEFIVKDSKGITLKLDFTYWGIQGTYGDYEVVGLKNIFKAKDDNLKEKASEAMAQYSGVYNLKSEEGTFTITVTKKGVTKLTGMNAVGNKVNASSQLTAYENVASVPFVLPKANIAFVVSFASSGDVVNVVTYGLTNAKVGRPGELVDNAKFRIDAQALANVVNDVTYAKYFPSSVPVKQIGTKWIVADGAKVGKVVINNTTGVVDETKTGENPSALKLTYTAKTGIFKGTFKVYVNVKCKPRTISAVVSGVLIDGIGYGFATIKKYGTIEVSIE